MAFCEGTNIPDLFPSEFDDHENRRNSIPEKTEFDSNEEDMSTDAAGTSINDQFEMIFAICSETEHFCVFDIME